MLIDSEDEIGSFGSPGTPPPTPDTSAISSPLHETYQINEEVIASEVKQLQEKCKSYKTLLTQSNESEHYLREKIQDQQSKMEDVILEANRRVVSIRTFWRDKIFREQNR